MKTEKLGGVAGGEGECGDDVVGLLVAKSLNILPAKTMQSSLQVKCLETWSVAGRRICGVGVC